VQARPPSTNVAIFDDLLVIVGGGSLDAELLREL
jgi:thiamine pyrophosphokinase